jgi:hypothetical protein
MGQPSRMRNSRALIEDELLLDECAAAELGETPGVDL